MKAPKLLHTSQYQTALQCAEVAGLVGDRLNKDEKPARPIMRYHGGKWILAPWIISHMPNHRIYVEPYGGAGSVLLRKPRVYAEVYNDLDKDTVNLFNVVRDRGPELIEKLSLTPFSRDDFEMSFVHTDCELERARRTVVRSFMGFGSAAATKNGNTSSQKPTTGFRSSCNRSGTTPAHDWANFPDSLLLIVQRLRGVVIENKPAIDVLKKYDSPETLTYLDPPYLPETRYNGDKTKCYTFEMSQEDHEDMCLAARSIDSMIIISGYDNDLYNDLLTGYTKSTRQATAGNRPPRKECLWLSPMAKNALDREKGVLKLF